MQSRSMDDVFQALAHASRRTLLDRIRDAPGSNVKTLCRGFDFSRIAVMKHLAVLEKAGLVVSRKKGRERVFYFNAVPIQQIHERWTDEYSAAWAAGLTRFARKVEDDVGRHARKRKSGI